MNHFDTIKGMLHSVSVYVPSTVNVSEDVDNTAKVRETLEKLSGLFGGCTGYDVKGAWISDSAGLVLESVTVCKSYTSTLNDDTLEEVYKIANRIKTDMGQESVSVEIDGALYFV